MFSRILLLWVFTVLSWHTSAQEIVVSGRFLSDTIKIGQPVGYSLSVRHPASQAVVFPDSAFAFKPFEFHNKQYFPTRTQNQVSTDSAVYFIETYEIDSLQALSLPVFVIHKKDCTAVYAEPDTIILKQLVGTVPESIAPKDLPLKANADYLSVSWLLNYPLLLIVAGALLLLVIIGWLIFGKRIRKYYQLKRLTRKHYTFLEQFAIHMEKMKQRANWDSAESALVLWKKYIEGLMGKPFTRLTTKEILRMADEEKLNRPLHQVDRIVYARLNAFELEAFDELLSYSEEQFKKKSEEVKHG